MIRTATGRDVSSLLARVRRHAERYSVLTICSPYLDKRMISEIVNTARIAQRAQCGLRVITSPASANLFTDALKKVEIVWPLQLMVRSGVHAKVYVAVGRPSKGRSEVIITSANLTERGIDKNVELGVRATAGTPQGRQLIAETNSFISRIAA